MLIDPTIDFPHAVSIDFGFRQEAGFFLSKNGIRKKDYRRIKGVINDDDSKGIKRIKNKILMDTYLFKKEHHAILFKLWLPEKPREKKSVKLMLRTHWLFGEHI